MGGFDGVALQVGIYMCISCVYLMYIQIDLSSNCIYICMYKKLKFMVKAKLKKEKPAPVAKVEKPKPEFEVNRYDTQNKVLHCRVSDAFLAELAEMQKLWTANSYYKVSQSQALARAVHYSLQVLKNSFVKSD